MRFLWLAMLVTYLTIHVVYGGQQPQSVLLENVQTLTLVKGQKAAARRVSSIPQLKCVGGAARGAYEPDVVQCYNRGSNGIDIQWECTADMPKKFKFGKLSVSCEGYTYPDDPYILAGSCGLEYNLEYADKSFQDSRQPQYAQQSTGSRLWSFLFKVALIVAVFFVVKSFISGGNRTGGVRPMGVGPDHRPPGGGGGGGGWFSNFFPGGFGGSPGSGDARRRQPPPAGFRTDFTNFGDDGANCQTNRPQNAAAGGGGGTGFLAGAALGALGGYAFGNRNRQAPRDTGNTGWFDNAGTTTTHRRTPSPSSSGTHTSTGFGGTTRR